MDHVVDNGTILLLSGFPLLKIMLVKEVVFFQLDSSLSARLKAVARKNVWGANLPFVSVYITTSFSLARLIWFRSWGGESCPPP